VVRATEEKEMMSKAPAGKEKEGDSGKASKKGDYDNMAIARAGIRRR
jgi:hypothetical protein